jgi:hypothetical protein
LRAATNGVVFMYRDHAIRNVKTSWRHTLKQARIRHVRFHDLRHTFNTRLLELGVLQEVRKALMGHSSGNNVHARYTHIELPLKRDAITRLDTWHQAQVPDPPGIVNATTPEEESHDGSEDRVAQGHGARAQVWKKKTPIEVVLEQADKLRQEITDGEAGLKEKRRQLQKLEEARKIFEA